MQLTSKRLLITEITVSDREFIYQLLNSPGWLAHIGDRNIKTLDDAEQYILNSFIKSYKAHGFGLFKMVTKKDNVPIGVCGLLKRKSQKHIDLGYAILPEYSGKGYTFEAAQMILHYARKVVNCKTVLAFTTEENSASQQLLKKLGFKLKGIEELEEFEGKTVIYGIDLR